MKKVVFLQFLVISLLTAFFCVPVFAAVETSDSDNFKPTIFDSPWYQRIYLPPVITITGGAAFSTGVGESQNFPIQDPTEDSFYNYSTSNNFQTAGLFGIFIADKWAPYPLWSLQGGLEYLQTFNFAATGNVTQGADVQSENTYTYSYNVMSRQVLAKAKVLYSYAPWYPYFSLGIGAAFNKATDFNTNVPPDLTFTRQYSSNTQPSFTYTIGFGLEYEISPKFRLGVGYQFTDFGNTQLGSTTIANVPVSGTLTQSHFYASEVIGQVTFLLGTKSPEIKDYHPS